MACEVPARPRLRFEASAQDDRAQLETACVGEEHNYGVRRLFTLGACDLTSVPEKNYGASEQKCEERRMRVCAWNALPPSAAPTQLGNVTLTVHPGGREGEPRCAPARIGGRVR